MIIKTMEELGKAIDEKLDIELQNRTTKDWIPIAEGHTIENLLRWVVLGEVRIKPESECIWVNVFENIEDESTVKYRATPYDVKEDAEQFTRLGHQTAIVIAHKIELPEAP